MARLGKRKLIGLFLATATSVSAGVGDPQLRTDHPWYPGELAISNFDRLFATQAEAYRRVTGRDVKTDEDKALASWLWRNTHYAHAEEGRQDCFAAGFNAAEWNREYWTGLFAHGFALCGTTHVQWTAEMNRLLGHARSRAVGTTGHNSFEVFLTGGAYGNGRWALLDHDLSTVIFAPDGSRLLSIEEVTKNHKQLTDPAFNPGRQRGWRVSGLHDGDARGVFDSFRSVEYLSGYAGPPPMVHLRRGETLTRYFEPGLADGQTFVFWGMNYNAGGIPGLERNRTWVNQPDKMFGSKNGSGSQTGRARYGNAVYEFRPFAAGPDAEGIVDRGTDHVTFEFRTPYVIAATPAAELSGDKWGVYKPGARNGLIVRARGGIRVGLSTDAGATFKDVGTVDGHLDLTDHVKGQNQYHLKFDAPAATLAKADLHLITVCQANPATFPRLQDGKNAIGYEASNLAITGTGPGKAGAQAHVVDGAMGTKSVTLELKSPAGPAVRVYAAGWVASGNPPDAKAASAIDYSTDGGMTWQPVVKDWRIERRGTEPKDFWSQSFVWGDLAIPETTQPIRVRFTNSGGKAFRKVEAYLAYRVPSDSDATAAFTWTDAEGAARTASQTIDAGKSSDTWTIDAGRGVKMKSVTLRAGTD